MEVKKVFLEEIQHHHPLILIDLQLMYQNYEEDDDDFDDTDMIEWQKSKYMCDMCGFEIDWYHRYYYKCSESCHYNLHQFCAELPTTLRFPAHPTHILILNKMLNNWTCHCCLTKHDQDGMCYLCSVCNYQINIHCATFVKENSIHYPCYPYPLACFAVDTVFCKCFACGKKHEGVFYHCATCFNFSFHINCVALSFKILLDTRHFSHPHMLTLSFSFSLIPYGSKCRICELNISYELWFYKCSKCRYYVHPDCVISRGEGLSISDRNKFFEDVDYPHLLHFPLPNESYHILPHQILREKNKDENGYFKHPSHEHPLLCIYVEDNNHIEKINLVCSSTTTMISLHDPMKRIKLLCNGCVRPITGMPFYRCDKCCDFYLHEWCTRLPTELQNHHGHVPQHTLALSLENGSYKKFFCNDSHLSCNGFRYGCSECHYYIDVNCGFITENITHEAHPNHILSKWRCDMPTKKACHVTIKCGEICFKCNTCDFYLDSRCALYFPNTIRHKYDKHSLKLSNSPIENHKSQYFCEVCEEDLNPEKCNYHCLECSQSIHPACAPLILKSEQDVNSLDLEGVYRHANIKFGSVIYVEYHHHPLSFVAGTKTDGNCTFCKQELHSELIFNCLQCKFGTHAFCHDMVTSFFGARMATSREIALLVGVMAGRKPMRKENTQHQPTVTFFPNGTTRPLTIGWKFVE